MRPKRDPVPRAKEAWWWLAGFFGLGLVGAAVVGAAIMLWESIDIRQLTPGLAEAPPVLPAALPPAPAAVPLLPFDAVLLSTEANRSYFENPDFYPDQMEAWVELVRSAGGRVRVANDASSLRGTAPSEVMVLPEAPCLSSDELAVVGAHLARGGSLITNWALGVRDGSCEWRGWGTLLDVTGAEALQELFVREALYLTVPGGLPVSPGLDPGTRVELRPEPMVALRMPGARVYWSDWAQNPAPDEEGFEADVALATVETEHGGRVTWFGLRAGQGATEQDEARIGRLLRSGVLWAAGTPSAATSPWPGAARAAVVFTLDVEGVDTWLNARDAAAMFALEELPISFYPVSALVEEDDELAADLSAAGEVGTQTVDHATLAGLTAQEQRMRLDRSWRDIESWTGVGPTGLRAPEEAVDSITFDSWKLAGGRYVLAANEARSASPELHPTSNGTVVLLPRLLKDDYTVIVRDVTLRSRGLASAWLAGLSKMRAIGGLAIVAGHTQILEAGPRLDAVRTVADTVRSQEDWWVTRADSVAEWWLGRGQVELRWADGVDASGDGGTVGELLVSMREGEVAGVGDLWVDVVLPAAERHLLPYVDGRSVDHTDEAWGMKVRVGDLAVGDTRTISFRPGPEEAGES